MKLLEWISCYVTDCKLELPWAQSKMVNKTTFFPHIKEFLAQPKEVLVGPEKKC